MRKDELLIENEQLKKDLADVCEHHKRLTRLLNQKIDEIASLKNEKKIKSKRK